MRRAAGGCSLPVPIKKRGNWKSSVKDFPHRGYQIEYDYSIFYSGEPGIVPGSFLFTWHASGPKSEARYYTVLFYPVVSSEVA